MSKEVEGKEPSEDVKKPEDSSTEEPNKPEEEYSEEDLQALSEQKHVPYDRFKEVNEQKKALKDEVESLKGKFDNELSRAIKDAETRLQSQYSSKKESEDSVDDWSNFDSYGSDDSSVKELKSEIGELKSAIKNIQSTASRQKVESELSSLKTKFPHMDETAVLGWKYTSDSSLEELAARSHHENVSRAEKMLQQILEQKKSKRENSMPSRTGGTRVKLDKKPESLSEASKLLKKYWEDMV